MKIRLFFALTIFLILAIFVTRENSDDDDNLVLNGTFNSGTKHWELGEGVKHNRFGGNKFSSALNMQASFKQKKPYIYESVAKQCISLQDNPAEFFILEADVKLDEIPKHLSSHRINLTWFKNAKCSSGGQYGWFLEPKVESGWQHLVKNDFRRSLGSQSVLITIVQNRSTSLLADAEEGATILAAAKWDNIKLISRATQSYGDPVVSVDQNKKNYILNNNFSEDTDWKHSKHRVTTSYVDFAGKNKSRAFRTNLVHEKEGGIGLGASNQCVNIPKKELFELGISYRVDESSTQKGGGRLRPTWYKFQNCKGASSTSTKHANIVESYDWVDLKIENLKAPEDVQSVRIELIQSIKGKGEYALFWDDAYLRALD